MKFQLIIQFSLNSDSNINNLITIEDRLELSLSETHEVDGHDLGSGQMNIFIHTNNPNGAFEEVSGVLTKKEIENSKIAFRETLTDQFTILWPKESNGDFNIN